MVDFSNDVKENKKITVQYINELFKRDTLIETLKKEENKTLFKSNLDSIYKCKLIPEEDKLKIKKVLILIAFYNNLKLYIIYILNYCLILLNLSLNTYINLIKKVQK